MEKDEMVSKAAVATLNDQAISFSRELKQLGQEYHSSLMTKIAQLDQTLDEISKVLEMK